MLNLTINESRLIAKGRNIDSYKDMLKEQLKDPRFIKPQRFRIPILIRRCKLTTLLRSGKPIDLYLYQELKSRYL